MTVSTQPRRQRNRDHNLSALVAETKARTDGASGVATGGDANLYGNMEAVLKGVTASWLAQAFRMDIKTVKQRLVRCRAMGVRGNNQFVYDLRDAAEHLLEPKMSIEEYMRRVDIDDLPRKLQSSYWDAKSKRLRYEENAGDLWRTERVVQAVSGLYKKIRSTAQLWVDQLGREKKMTEDQRVYMERQVDDLLSRLFHMVHELHTETGNVLVEDRERELEQDIADVV